MKTYVTDVKLDPNVRNVACPHPKHVKPVISTLLKIKPAVNLVHWIRTIAKKDRLRIPVVPNVPIIRKQPQLVLLPRMNVKQMN